MQGEQVYDHGYGLVSFVANTYGPESIDVITRSLKKPWRLNMDGALRKATGKSGNDLYKDWRAYLEDRYTKQTAGIRDNLRTGTLVFGEDYKKAYLNVQPVFSPDGRTIAYMSNMGSDYAWQTLYTMDRSGKERKRIRGGVNSAAQFTPDGKKLLYSRKHKINKYGWLQNDVFVYDLETKKEKQLTEESRIADVDFSPDGSTIIGVKNGDGTHQIVLMDADGKNERVLLDGPKGIQFYTPHYSPDGSKILFGIFDKGTREIAVVSNDGSGFRYVLGMKTPNDERNARWSEDGTRVILSCDRTGIFNIYEVDLENETVAMLTNVIGGAFMPDDSPGDGAIAYSHYSGEGYSVYLLDGDADPVETMDLATFVTRDAEPYDECENLKTASAQDTGSGPAAVLAADTPPVLAAAVASQNGAPGLWPSGVMGTGVGVGMGGYSSIAAGGADLLGASLREDFDTGEAGVAAGYGMTAGSAAPQDSVASDDGVATGSSLSGGVSSPAHLPIESPYPEPSHETDKYKSRYSIFQLFPRIVVWDNKLRLGLFMTSNEILDKQTLFAGGAYGVDGEYDAYFSYEIRNFYPTIFADFVILRELHADNSFDEETGSEYIFDTKYNLWQWNIGLRLDLSEPFSLTFQHQLAAFWSHGEYRVHLEGDEYRYDEYFGSFKGGWKYYIGNEGVVRWTLRSINPAVDADINPRGGRLPIFSSVIDRNVDDFFWTYVGGRDYNRGYSFYSIGGRKAALASLTYRFPVFRNINKQLLNLYFRDFYVGMFCETANAWTERGIATSGWKNSVGIDLRLSLGSYYLFPTAISFVSAYALDPVQNVLFGFGQIPLVIRQERGWRFYTTVGFAFDL
jgi:Tol biopolymer transport system component